VMACRWLQYARRDLEVARLLLNEGYPGESTFHAQQAAEKALKAVLVALGVQPPKTHQLEYLMTLIKQGGIDIQEVREASLLTDYAVETRYPDFGEEPSLEEAREALRLAERTVEWAQWRLREMGVECSQQPPL